MKGLTLALLVCNLIYVVSSGNEIK
jgi:hypothetical protein